MHKSIACSERAQLGESLGARLRSSYHDLQIVMVPNSSMYIDYVEMCGCAYEPTLGGK